MQHFKVFEKKFDIDIDGEKYTFVFQPLTGEYFADLASLSTKFGEDKELDREAVKLLHDLVFVTMCNAVKPKDDVAKDSLNRFVSQNLFSLVGPLMEVNFHKKP